MNKVFKVIWSEARNAYVVVSEMAKSHGTKSCSTKKLLAMLIATGVMTCASVAPAMAANLAPTETKIEIGEDASASGEGTVTITGVAKAEDVAVVYDANGSLKSTNAKSVESNAIALGKGASAVKESVAIGNGASVVKGSNGSGGVALGNQAHAGYKGTSLGSNAISGQIGRASCRERV